MAVTTQRTRVHYVCSACGSATPKWQGRCSACGEWNTLVEEIAVQRPTDRRPSTVVREPVPLAAALADRDERLSTRITECDLVLGGGIVAGSLILLGGDPGIGKSTLAMQVGSNCGDANGRTLYCTGEETPAQLAARAQRLGCDTDSIAVLHETDLSSVIAAIEKHRPPLAIVDSVQTIMDEGIPSAPGSVSQVRGAVAQLVNVAKATDVPIILVGHVTKEGAIAGPRTLEHMVDVVLYLEGEHHGDHRLLRGVKNRFGATGELGILTMTEQGLTDTDGANRAFFDEGSLTVPGNVLTVLSEGSRAIAVEVQALVVPTVFGIPRRTASGFDLGRLHVLLAVLEKRVGMSFAQADVYVNAAGGFRLSEPACDLAVTLALASASADRPIAMGTTVIGEVGLGGEVRRVSRIEARLHEAARLGMSRGIIPEGSPSVSLPVTCMRVATLRDAVRSV